MEVIEGKICDEIIPFIGNYSDEFNSIIHFTNWPVVYIIYNKSKGLAYVGETVDLKTRLMQHYQDPKKKELIDKNTKVIFIDYNFANKSSCLDLESFLIYNMHKDGKYTLLNGNVGLQKYEYYGKDKLLDFCKKIWNRLEELKIVTNKFEELENKKVIYSPYMALNQEQNYVVKQIIKELTINDKRTIIVNGGAGTGKTALAIHLLKLLKDYANNNDGLILEDMVDEKISEIKKIIDWFSNNNIKIGIIFPMSTIYNIVNKCINNMFPKETVDFVFQPYDAVEYYLKNKRKIDILIVDEAQRLTKPGIINYSDRKTQVLKDNGFIDKNQMEWILEISNKQVIFYDDKQRIRKGDIDPEYYEELKRRNDTVSLELTVQERCLYGGDEYIECLRKIFNSETVFNEKTINEIKTLINSIKNKKSKIKYEFALYNDIYKMTNRIKELYDDEKGKSKGMCYTLTGNCWPVKNKIRDEVDKKFGRVTDENYNEYVKEIIKNNAHNIEIGDYKNIYNSVDNWVNRETYCKNEIGVIHTIAGLDAEYVGVIIGEDLTLQNNRLKEIKENYKDKGKNNASNEEILEFILDSYYVLCSRARRGTFLYICNPKLRELFSKFMNVIN